MRHSMNLANLAGEYGCEFLSIFRLQQSFLKSERGAGVLPLRGGAAPTPLFTTNL
jgi:hypothetical protein